MGSSPIRIAIFSADLAHLVERDLAKVEVAGSSPVIRSKYASVAQLVEQRTENPRVVGSIPTGGTIFLPF